MEQLKRIRNGAKVKPTFSAAELNRRLTALRGHMAEARIDVCLFTSHHNIAYFSDFLYCSFGRNYGLAVTQEDQTTISANIDGGQPWRRSFGDNLVYTDWHRDNFFAAVKTLIDDGIAGRHRVRPRQFGEFAKNCRARCRPRRWSTSASRP